MNRGARESRRSAERTDHSRALVRKVLLEIGQRRSARDARACGEMFALIETALAIRRHLLERIAKRGISEAKFCTMTLLVGGSPAPWTPSDLAYHAGVTRATMTDVLDQMMDAGWITRARSGGDRRRLVVQLTAKGRKEADAAIETLIAAATELLGPRAGTGRMKAVERGRTGEGI